MDYINFTLMVDNWLPSFDMKEQKKIDKKVEEQMATILADLKAQKNMISAVTEADFEAHREFLARMNQLPSDGWQHLLNIIDACVGCGSVNRSVPPVPSV